MRIGLIIYGRLELLTGGFLYDRFLVDALRRRGHRVEILGLDWRPYPACLLDNFSGRVRARARRGGWDLVLQDGLCHPSLIGFNRRIRRAGGGPPLIAVVHQVLSRQPRPRLMNLFFGRVEQAYLQTVDAALANSSDTQDKVRRLAGREIATCVAPPGGDRLGFLDSEAEIVARSRKPGPLELLFVGNLSPVKGLDLLLESLDVLDGVPWRLTVVGGRAPAVRLGRRRRPKAPGRQAPAGVRFAGQLDGGDLREVFTRSHLFAMPFAHEGFGIAALEAMAFGLPVIASEAGGVRAFVQHGVNGFLVAPGDRVAVCRYLQQLHADRGQLARMGRAARQTARTRPGWQASMARAAGFLEGFVDS
jgi:glycosyltransferase involved in cell wall biosynthesis